MDAIFDERFSHLQMTDERCRALVEFIELNHRKKPADTTLYLDLLFHELETLDDDVLKAKANIYLGRICWFRSDFQMALVSFKKSLAFAEKTKDSYLIMQSLTGLGNVFADSDQYDESLKLYFEALKLAEDENNMEYIVAINNNIGEVYKHFKVYDEALEHYQYALHYADGTLDQINPHIIGIVTQNIGEIKYVLGQFEEARNILFKALDIHKNNQNYISIGAAYSILAELEYKEHNTEKSVFYFEESDKLFEELYDRVNHIPMLVSYAKLLMECGQMKAAGEKLILALDYAKSLKQNFLTSKVTSALAEFYEASGQFDEALRLYKDYHDVDKESERDKNKQRLNSIKARVESEEISRRSDHYQTTSAVYKERSEELEKAYEQISLISNIGKRLTSTLDFNKLYEYINDSLSRMMPIDTFLMSVYDQDTKCLNIEFFMEEGSLIQTASIAIENTNSLMAWCFRNNKDIISGNIIPEFGDYVEETAAFAGKLMTRSVIYIPIQYQSVAIGVLSVQSKREDAFNTHQLDLLKALSAYIAIAINNASKSKSLVDEIENRKVTQIELENLNRHLKSLSERDGLTGVYNRHRLEEYMQDLEKSKENGISIYMMDIDYFKNYNDTYGHLIGDEALIEVARVLELKFEESGGFFARYGGEEFVGILTKVDKEGAKKLSEELLEVVQQLDIPHQGSPLDRLTISIGWSLNNKLRSLDKALSFADRALYLSKRTGRNKVSFHE